MDHATTGDGALTGAFLLDVVVGTGHSLSLLAGVMQKFPQILRNVMVRDRAAIDSDAQLQQEISDIEGELAPDGRVLVRASGTEPVIRVMGEGDDKALVEAAVDDVVEALTEVAA
jgi:phosphoglucosamine mutase